MFGASSFVSFSELPSSCRWGWAGGPDLLCSSPSPVGGPCAPRLHPSGSGPGRSLPARGCFLRGWGGSGRPARPPRPSGGDRGPSAGLVLGERFQELPGWHLVGPLWPLLPQLPGQQPPMPLRGSPRPHLGLARFSALGGQGDGVWLAQGLGPGQEKSTAALASRCRPPAQLVLVKLCLFGLGRSERLSARPFWGPCPRQWVWAQNPAQAWGRGLGGGLPSHPSRPLAVARAPDRSKGLDRAGSGPGSPRCTAGMHRAA